MKYFRRLLAAAKLALVIAAAITPASAVDVSNLSDIEADPCFQQAHQRALDSNLGVIESQIVAACGDAHGNPTDAMALLKERAKLPPWLPPAAGGMSAATVLAAALTELALIALLLGVDPGYAARALGVAARPGAAVSAGLIVVARLAAALLLTALASLPAITLLLAASLLAFAVRVCRWTAPQAASAAPANGGAVAMLATDLMGNLPVALGIAVVSRGSLVLAAGGVGLAAIAARLLHPAVARVLRRHPALVRAAAFALAWIAVTAALSDPAMSSLPAFASLSVPIAIAAVVAAFGRLTLRGSSPPTSAA